MIGYVYGCFPKGQNTFRDAMNSRSKVCVAVQKLVHLPIELTKNIRNMKHGVVTH